MAATASSSSTLRDSNSNFGPIEAHGGQLVNLVKEGQALETLMRVAAESKHTLQLNSRQICDLELLMNGGFSPLTGFMNEEDYNGVVNDMHLKSANGALFPMPITLDVSAEFAENVASGDVVSLRDDDKRLLAVVHVESKWRPDKVVEAEKVFGSPDDECHPSISYLFNVAGEWYLGGTVEGAAMPVHYDYTEHRRTPDELRSLLKKMAWTRVVGFQTRNPMHRSHREVTIRAARRAHANVLVHPVVGMTKPGDVDHFTRVRCYLEIMKTYPVGMAKLSLLPLAMRMGGPREALWHGIIRQNYGLSHFVVGRSHACPGKSRSGEDFYGMYDAQELCAKHQSELKIEFLYFQSMYYVEERGEYCTEEEAEGLATRAISGTELRRRLYLGIPIPSWFSFPSVVEILQKTYPPREKQGFCIFFTGFSGAGKSTLANALVIALQEDGRRPVTLLDGDVIRTHLSSELGFSKRDRDINIRRVGACQANHCASFRSLCRTQLLFIQS
jgi:sulfate adenylyltransferase